MKRATQATTIIFALLLPELTRASEASWALRAWRAHEISKIHEEIGWSGVTIQHVEDTHAAIASSFAERLVPPVPPWPDGLPDPQRLEDGSVVVSPDLAKAQFERDLLLIRYPALCSEALKELAGVDDVACTGRLNVQSSEANEASDQRNASAEAHRFTLSKALTVVGITAAVTAVVTILAESKKSK